MNRQQFVAAWAALTLVLVCAGGSLHGATITESQGEIAWDTEELLAAAQSYRLEKVASDGRILIMESFSDPNVPGSQGGNRFIHVANFLDWLERLESGR